MFKKISFNIIIILISIVLSYLFLELTNWGNLDSLTVQAIVFRVTLLSLMILLLIKSIISKKSIKIYYLSIPFILAILFSIYSIFNGFTEYLGSPTYGIEALKNSLLYISYQFLPMYIISIVSIIINYFKSSIS